MDDNSKEVTIVSVKGQKSFNSFNINHVLCSCAEQEFYIKSLSCASQMTEKIDRLTNK